MRFKMLLQCPFLFQALDAADRLLIAREAISAVARRHGLAGEALLSQPSYCCSNMRPNPLLLGDTYQTQQEANLNIVGFALVHEHMRICAGILPLKPCHLAVGPCAVTYVPKYFGAQAGNGCHAHLSLWRDGKSIMAAGGQEGQGGLPKISAEGEVR
jgi:hypothetical protein